MNEDRPEDEDVPLTNILSHCNFCFPGGIPVSASILALTSPNVDFNGIVIVIS